MKKRQSNVRSQVLEAAAKAVNGERNLNYGEPEDNFERIARLWNAHIKNRLPTQEEGVDGVELNGVDVAIMLQQVKHARLANQPNHRDSWVDIAGYAACGAEVSGS